MMKKINLLIVEPYPFGKICGNLRTLSYILEHIDPDKIEPHLLVPFESEFTQGLRQRGIDYTVISPLQPLMEYGGKWGQNTILERLQKMIASFAYNAKMVSLLKNRDIDVIYCNCIRSVTYIGIAAKFCSIPLVWYVKGELNNKFIDQIGFLLASKIVFFSEINKNDRYQRLTKIFHDKIEIVKIGIDPNELTRAELADKTNLRQELAIDPEKFNIVTVGRLYREKGAHFLLEALSRIIKDFPQVMLYIVGDPVIDEYQDYPRELQTIISKHNLGPHVRFTGWRQDVLEIVSLMDILVHPSLAEGFGRAALEAFALGKAVVASRVGGLREFIQDGENGFLVTTGDVQTIAEKITILIKDPELRESMGKAARAKVFSEYLLADKIARLESLWIDLARRGKNFVSVAQEKK